MNISKIAAILAVGLLLPIAAHAANVYPSSSVCATPLDGNNSTSAGISADGSAPGEPYSAGYLNDITSSANTSCNVLITFNANGSITTTNPNGNGSYDAGGDDNLVGIVNNSGHAITAINLSSATTDIFGFDGDGICGGYIFATGPNCGTEGVVGGNDNYLPTGVSVSGVSSNDFSGTVDFAGAGIASGSAAFFSLEGPVDLNLTVTSATPEPSSLMLLGTGVLGMAGLLRRRIVNAVR